MTATVVTLDLAALCVLPLLYLFIPTDRFLQVFIEQANIDLVVEDLEIVHAMQRGWEVIKDNFGSVLGWA